MTPEPVHFALEDQETWLKTPKNINKLSPKVSVGFGLPMWFVDNKNVEHHQIFPSKLSGFCEKPTNVWCLKSSTFPLEKESTSSLKQNRRHVNDKKSAKYFKSSRGLSQKLKPCGNLICLMAVVCKTNLSNNKNKGFKCFTFMVEHLVM